MKILIRATNWVGDAIMALPALRAVRARFPEAEIGILARPYVADIYRHQDVADRLVPYDVGGLHGGFSGRENLAAELREQKYDVALLLQNAFDAAWLAWRAGIPERIGYARDGRSLFLTKAIRVPKPGEIPAHEKFYYLELLRRAGWLDSLPEELSFAFSLPTKSCSTLRKFLQGPERGQSLCVWLSVRALPTVPQSVGHLRGLPLSQISFRRNPMRTSFSSAPLQNPPSPTRSPRR